MVTQYVLSLTNLLIKAYMLWMFIMASRRGDIKELIFCGVILIMLSV